jgi:hypothetical protein
MFAFYFLEKPRSNPHWHGLVRLFPVGGVPLATQEKMFDEHAERAWKKLVPAGSVNVQPITSQRGVSNYVTKALGHSLEYASFVTPGEFRHG